MNKFLQKVAKIFLGLSMAAGVGVAITPRSAKVEKIDAAISTVYLTGGASSMPTTASSSATTVTQNSISYGIVQSKKQTDNNAKTNCSWMPDNSVVFMTKNTGKIYNTTALTGGITGLKIYTGSGASTSAKIKIQFGTSTVTSVSSAYWTSSALAKGTEYDLTSHIQASKTYFCIQATNDANVQIGIQIQYGTEDKYTVTYSGNGNTGGSVPEDSTQYTKGTSVTVKANSGNLTKTGYSFGGWNTNTAGTGTNYAAGTGSFTISGNTTLHAKWTPTVYSVSYDLDGGTHGSADPISGTYDTAFSVSAPTKTGYTFTGWTVTSGLNTSTAKWGTTSSPSTAISSSSTLCVNGTNAVYFKNINAASTAVTLTANWSINAYTVNGGDATANISHGSLSSASSVNYNSALDISIIPDDGYTFPSSIESVTMGGPAYSGYNYDSSDGSFYIEHVTGNIVIVATCVDASATEYVFDYQLSNCSIVNAPASMYSTEIKELQIVPDDHFKLPAEDANKVSVTGAVDWSYDDSDGTITIDGAEDDLTVTVECVAKAQNTIEISTDGVTKQSGPTSVEEGETISLVFVANTNYALPTSSGVTVTGDESHVWTQSSGTLQITGGTSDITVSIIGIQRDLTDGSLTTGSKKTDYTLGDDFELPSTVTANFNLAPLTVNVKNDVVVSGPVVKNSSKYIVTSSGTITLTYTYEPTGSTQSASYAITATPITPSTEKFVKVTSGTVASGKYLIVNETASVAFDGGINSTSYDVTSNIVSVSIANNEIAYSSAMDAASFTFDSTAGTLRSAAGYYIYRNGTSNGVTAQTTVPSLTTSITVSNGNAVISNVKDSSTMRLRYNNSSGQDRFRYYSSDSVAAIQIYKYQEGTVKELKWITAELKSGIYYKGTSVTASNFTVTAHYDDGSTSSVTSGISITNGTLNNLGENDVTLTYSGKSYVVKVTAVQAPVSSLTLDTNAASIGLDESYWLSDIGVTVSPSYAIQDYTWSLEDDGGLTEGVDYTFDGDEYYSINPGTVVFRCTSDADASKYADFTLTISGTPGISVTESELNGFVGKGATLHFVYSNISDSDLGKIHFESSNSSVVDFADGIDASEGTGIIEIEYLSAGNATISVKYNNGETLDTVSVSVENDNVKTVTWSASNIDVWSGATLSTTGWNVQYEMDSGDHGAASSYVIKLVGQETTEIITAGYEFKGTDNGKTIHVEYGGVSSSSIAVTVTQRINNVYAATWVENTWSHVIGAKTWSAAGSQTLDGKSWTQGGTGNGYWGYEDARGQQFGSGSSPYNPLTLESSAFTGTISKVEVTTAGASSVVGTVSVSVGGTSFKCGNETSVSITTTSTKYTFTGTGSGTITISWSQTSSKAFYLKALSVTTLTQGQSVQIANSESHKAAQRVAVAYATAFNDAMDDTENCTTGLDAAWAKCQTAYNTFKTQAAALGSTEEEYANNLVKYATRQYSDDSGEACLERMMKTYEVMVQKHGKSAYMSELVTLGAPQVSPLINMFNGQNTNTIAIIVIISMVSMTAIGGYFFIRKRKEN